ncbi:unnamed protein product [Linum trigynum]|uniref:Uncharacterized protein n=1 Tax=Linum trigynum TaxID=586398 RepID=A0AAV2FR94_9ROSI
MCSNLHPKNLDDHRWIINIRRSLEEQEHLEDIVDLEDSDDELTVRIFNVPKPLLSTHPDSYTPQQVAIGPYHHHRPELHEAARHKHSSARRLQRQLQPPVRFPHIVERLMKLGARIRDCYHKYLDFSDETLAWMMAIDGSLLLELLRGPPETQERLTTEDHDVQHHGRSVGSMLTVVKSGQNSGMIRDVMMLENQIPMIVLRKILEVQHGTQELGDEKLRAMLVGFCREVSPFKMMDDFRGMEVSCSAHLLDYLYQTILPNQVVKEETAAADRIKQAEDSSTECNDNERSNRVFLTSVKRFTSKLDKDHIKRLLLSRPVKFVLRLPFTILTNLLPGFAILRHPVEYFIFSSPPHDGRPGPSNSNNNFYRPPLLEEITIPSVTELVSSGVHIVPTVSSISSISFDTKSSKLHLPIVSLDVNTEVVLRNLVAYEASNASVGPLVFTRYTELMNGIIDTGEDVKLLRERGVVLNHLKSDDEAADLWNGMSKSIRLTRVAFLDDVIAEVNLYYNGRWKVRIGRFMGQYVFASWQSLTLLAAVLILVLMAFQVFCSVYNWYRILSIRRATSTIRS